MSDHPFDAEPDQRSSPPAGDAEAPRRLWWRFWRRRPPHPRRAVVVFDSRRKADDDQTRSSGFDPTEGSRHLIYRLDNVDIAVSAYTRRTDGAVAVVLTGHVLGGGGAADLIVARQQDGTVVHAPIGPDGEFEIDLVSHHDIHLEHHCDGAATALGLIDVGVLAGRHHFTRDDVS